jgi:hypothetical protein
MKKNKMMRTASALLVLVLLTVSIICGTFAKYTASAEAENSTAKVANWGVNISATGSLFSNTYLNSANGNKPGGSATSNITVSSSTNDLVAPGTKNDTGLELSITGTPEVSTTLGLTVSAQDVYLAAGTYGEMRKVSVTSGTFTSLKNAGIYTLSGSAYTKVTGDYDSSATYYQIDNKVTVASGGYYPIKYTITADSTTSTATSAKKLAHTLAGKVATVSESSDASVKYEVIGSEIAAGTDLSSKFGTQTIKWSWDFDDSTNGTYDKQDTILGDLIAGGIDVVQVGASDAVTKLSVATSTGVVTAGENTVGSVKAVFEVELTATQVD